MGNLAGKALPYAPGAPVGGFKYGSDTWTVLEGTPTAEPSATAPVPGQALYRSVLIHKFDKRAAAAGNINPSSGKPEVPHDALEAVRNAMRRLKMLRHPYVLRFVVRGGGRKGWRQDERGCCAGQHERAQPLVCLTHPLPHPPRPPPAQDGGETDDALLMVTEPAVPLAAWLEANKPGDDGSPGPAGTRKADFDASCVWGVYSLVTGLNFLAGCDLLHGNVSVDSVWVTKGGDWKLGGFDACTEATPSDGGTFPDRWFRDHDGAGPCPAPYKAPERAGGDWTTVAGAPRTALDAYSLGVALLEVFAPQAIARADDVRAAAEALRSPSSPVPAMLRPLIARLVAPAPRSRPSFADLLGSDYFRHPLVVRTTVLCCGAWQEVAASVPWRDAAVRVASHCAHGFAALCAFLPPSLLLSPPLRRARCCSWTSWR